jgi:hypothetical protein
MPYYMVTYRVEQRRKAAPFPMDMLRYAHTWPADDISALNIGLTHQHKTECVVVNLTRISATKRPTLFEDRWKSFGWEMTGILESRQGIWL